MRALILIALASLGCVLRAGDDDESTTTGTTTATDTGTETTDGCPQVPLCDYCPDVMSSLCGLPCDDPGASCSNEIGDAMVCADGQWECIVHPPLEPGECNAECRAADACSEIGCDGGFVLSLVADAGPMPAGLYEIDLQLDGQADGCSFEILDDPDACAIVPCVGTENCNALYQLSEPPHTVSLIYGVVALIEGEVRHDGVALAPGTFPLQPSYDIVAPNGSGCGPVCAQAGLELTVP